MSLTREIDKVIKGPFALDVKDVFFVTFSCRHVWTVPLVTSQPISEGIKISFDNLKILRRCRQVWTVPNN